jgi:hypothetical protein
MHKFQIPKILFDPLEQYERLWLLVQFHLPESRSKVQGGEDFGICSSNVPNALGDFLHWIFVDVRVLVQFSKVLHNPESLTLFFGYAENGGVV